jgi:hypothetical protein
LPTDEPKEETKMIAFEFPGLSMPEAEEVIAALWCCFEEYDVPSPAMTFKFHGGARASVLVHIKDAAVAKVVARFLSDWKHSNGAIPIASRQSILWQPEWVSVAGSALNTRH